MMNFKDLQFSLGKLSSDVKTHIAKKNPLHKQDTKTLSLWIFHERNDLATMKTLAYRKGETNKSFKEWILHSHEAWNEYDELTDLQDIGDKLATLLDKQAEIEKQYAARYQQYRHAIKSIREREEQLCDIREKRRTLQSRLAHLEKTNPTSPKRQEIEAELVILDKETQYSELELSDFKRFVLKEAFYIRFNAMVEYADKLKMIAGFGKYIVDLLDVEPTVFPTTTTEQAPSSSPSTSINTTNTTNTTNSNNTTNSTMNQQQQEPILRKQYTGESQTSLILNDCLLALDEWKPVEEDERPTLANQAIHDALHDDDAMLLSEEDIQYYRKQGLGSLYFSSSNEKSMIQNYNSNNNTLTKTATSTVPKSQEALLDRMNQPSPLPPPPAYSATTTTSLPSQDQKKSSPITASLGSKITSAINKDNNKDNKEKNKVAKNEKLDLSQNKKIGGMVASNTTTTTKTAHQNIKQSQKINNNNKNENNDHDNLNQNESPSPSSSSNGVQRSISVYKPDLKDDYPLMDYYLIYRNNPVPSNNPRSYTDFQQQYLQYQKK